MWNQISYHWIYFSRFNACQQMIEMCSRQIEILNKFLLNNFWINFYFLLNNTLINCSNESFDWRQASKRWHIEKRSLRHFFIWKIFSLIIIYCYNSFQYRRGFEEWLSDNISQENLVFFLNHFNISNFFDFFHQIKKQSFDNINLWRKTKHFSNLYII